jgi:predicted esterase
MILRKAASLLALLLLEPFTAFATADLPHYFQETESSEDLCLRAQSLIGSYDLELLRDKSSMTLHTNVDDFVRSKPRIQDGLLAIQVYSPNPQEAQSEYPQLWCKLKSAADIARSRSIELNSTGPNQNCDRINQAFFDQLLTASAPLKTAYDSSGYKISFLNKSFYTGAEWAPSSPSIILNGKSITIRTTSLESLPGIPVIGGMNYCKFVAPQGLQELIQDLAKGEQSNFSKISLGSSASPLEIAGPKVTFQTVALPKELNGFISRKADLYWPKSQAKGVFVVSPGGGVQPLHMRGLARQLAEEGHGVFVIHYPADMSIFEKLAGQKNSAFLYGERLKAGELEQFQNLAPEIKTELQTQNLPIRFFGHSLGGAILGDAIFKGTSPFDQVILYGTLSFIQTTQSTVVSIPNLQMLVGEHDGLSLNSPDALSNFLSKYGFTEKVSPLEHRIPETLHSLQVIPNLNHFCIVSDMTSGYSLFKSQDLPGPTPSECIPDFVDYLKARDMA